MTREEAIRHLGTYSSTMGSGLTTQEQHEEAKRMAIEALERGPYFTISYDDDKLRELCQRAAEELKEQFVNVAGKIPSEDEFFITFGDGNYANIGGFTEEDHIVHKIRRILSKWAVSEHPELTKVEYFDKIVELMNKV